MSLVLRCPWLHNDRRPLAASLAPRVGHGQVALIGAKRWRDSCHFRSVGIVARQSSAIESPQVIAGPRHERKLKLESLEPYFYYMGKKWGMKAYGVMFKEFLRCQPGEEPTPVSGGEETGEQSPFDSVTIPEEDLFKGVGVYTTQEIEAGEEPKIVMEIPLPLMLTLSREHPWMFYPNIVPLGHPVFDVINDTDPEQDWDLRLACLLLLAMDQSGASRKAVQADQEGGNQQMSDLQVGPHFFTEYSDFLPPLEDSPALLLASEEDLKELQDDELEGEIRSQQLRVRGFWEKHWQGEAKPPRALARLAQSEQQLQWAVAQAQSRGVLLHAPMGIVEQDGHLLIPYADMLNHSFTPNCYLFWRQKDRVIEVRVKPGTLVDAGEELTLNYVGKGASNRELMKRYGFSMTKNPWESVVLSGQHKIHRETFLSAFDIVGFQGGYVYSFPVDEDDWDPFEDETVIAAANCLPMWSDGAVPSVPSEEIRAAKLLQGELKSMLQTFPTQVDDDLELLADEAERRSAAWAVAVKYRIDQKLFILRLMDTLEMYMERLLV